MTEKVLTGVGAALKQEREAAGLAVADVAQRLKLLPRQIESLEHERFDRLPGPAIARGMVRNYARLLELDPEPLLERMAPREREPEGEELPPAGASRRSTTLYAFVAVTLLALAGALAYLWQGEAPEAPRAPVQKPPETALEKPPTPVVEKPAESEKPPVAKAPDKPKPEEKTPAEPQAAEPVVAPGDHRLVLRMEEEAWLEVRDGTGRSLVSSLHAAGTERVVRGQPPFELVVGNAAHVTLTYDGKPIDLKPHMRREVARFTLN